MYMLDTNIIIFAMRHPDSYCAKKLVEHIGIDVCISAVTYAELVYGIRNSSDPDRNRKAVTLILAGIHILDFDAKAAEHFGDILADLKKRHMERPTQDRDKMIAAHARSLGCTIVTDNIKEFADIRGIELVSWRSDGDLK